MNNSTSKDNKPPIRKALKKTGFVFLVFAGFLFQLFIVLFFITFLVLQSDRVQLYLTGKIENYLVEKTATKVEVERVFISFPKYIGISGLYIEDREGDTLIDMGRIRVDLQFRSLLDKNIVISSLRLDDFTGKIERKKDDQKFNYTFLIESFSGNNKKEKENNSDDPWGFNLKRIALKNIDFGYYDYAEGMLFDLQFKELSTSFKDISFDKNGVSHLNRFSLYDADIFVDVSNIEPSPDQPEETELPDISLKRADMGNIKFSMVGSKEMNIDAYLGNLQIIPEFINLNLQELNLEKMAINEGHFIYNPPVQSTDTTVHKKTDKNNIADKNQNNTWNIAAKEFIIADFDFFFNNALPIDGFHKGIKLRNINSKIDDIYYNTDSVGANISNIAFYQEGGINIRTLKGQIHASENLNINDFSLQTTNSSLQADIDAGINIFKTKDLIKQNPPINIHHSEGTIGEDLAMMIPGIKEFFQLKHDENPVKFGMQATGRLNEIYLDTLWFNAGQYFTGQLKGTAKDYLWYNRMRFDLDTFSIMVIPDNAIPIAVPGYQTPENISLPRHLLLNGSSSITANTFDYNIRGFSRQGWFESEGTLSGLLKNEIINFKTEVDFTNIDVAYILKNDTLFGKTSGNTKISGIYENFENADIEFVLSVYEAGLNNYIYKDFKAKGKLKNKTTSVDLLYDDEYLSFDLKADIALHENTNVKLSGNLNRIFLKELNLLEDDLRITMNLSSDFTIMEDNWIEGDAGLFDTRIYQNMSMYFVDSLLARSWSSGSDKNINISSDFLDIEFSGNINPIELPSLLKSHIYEYMADKPLLEEDTASTQGKKFILNAKLKPSTIVTEIFFSEMIEYQSILLESRFDGDNSTLSASISCQNIAHQTISLNDINIDLISGYDELNFTTEFQELVYTNQSYKNFVLTGSLFNDIFDFNLSFDDVLEQSLFNLDVQIFEQDNMWAIKILPDNFVINYDNWHVDKDNIILLGDNKQIIKNLDFSHNGQQININTSEHDEQSPTLQAGITDFNLKTISGLMQDTGYVEGTINGYVDLHNFMEKMTYSAELDLLEFTFRNNKIGNIHIRSHSTPKAEYSLYANIHGFDNDMEISGIYNANSENPFDFDVAFPNLNLKSFEGFVYQDISNLKGNAEGKFILRGSPDNPDLTGSINFQETSFTVNYLNTNIILSDEVISFKNNTILFENFRFNDAHNNTSIIDGVINLKSVYDIAYNLNIKSDNFEFLNISEGQNDLFHGRVLVDSDINIRGDLGNPEITGRLQLNQGSRFTYFVPHISPELIDREGIVEFWVPADTLLHTDQVLPEIKHTVPFKNLDISLNIDIDRAAGLNIVLDEAAGDYLEIRGGGVISLGVNPAGELTLAGRYDVTEGTYQLTFYDFVRKRFNIRSGSNIIWTGHPMKAQLDIAAIYNTRAPVRDLVETRVTTGQDIDARMLNQIAPFNVILQMKGDLERPEISFQIDMPAEHRNILNGNVYRRIEELNQNESELNKQVFSLLVFDRFMTDNLTALFGPANGATAAARTSASRIMTQQLNRLSDKYIQNIDLTFDVESYQDFASSDLSGRTELQLELTKDFFDERVIVTVGGNIELEDHEGRQTNPGELAGDVSVEYLLTEDGSLRLKGFRKNEHKDVFEGQVTETGVSLLFMRNFNQFNELWRREDDKEQ